MYHYISTMELEESDRIALFEISDGGMHSSFDLVARRCSQYEWSRFYTVTGTNTHIDKIITTNCMYGDVKVSTNIKKQSGTHSSKDHVHVPSHNSTENLNWALHMTDDQDEQTDMPLCNTSIFEVSTFRARPQNGVPKHSPNNNDRDNGQL